MSFLARTAIRSSSSGFSFFTRRNPNPIHHGGALPFFLRDSSLPKHFSTGSEQEQPPASSSTASHPPPPPRTSTDPFFQTPGGGLVYGKLSNGISAYTLKTDIIRLLDSSDLTPDDIKVLYTRGYMPFAMMLQFHSRQAFDNAFRALNRKGRMHKLERRDRSDWEIAMPYNGKTIVLVGVPRTALPEDVERFLSGCNFDASSIQLFLRPGYPDKLALVRFPTRTEAMSALITKNRGFCLNNQITMRVLE